MRKLIVDALYAQARLITYVADWFADPADDIWRTRQWRTWDRQRKLKPRAHQRHYVSPCRQVHHG